jgi:hypothetical protein
MKRRTALTLMTMGLLSLAVALPAGNAVAQQKGHVSYNVSAKDTMYTQELNITVDDAPNHIVRVYEFRRVFPSNAPVINGIEVAEEWTRGIHDRTAGSGTTKLYSTLVMKNGDKIFSELTAIVVPNSTTGRTDGTFGGKIIRGTGKFAGITGLMRGTNSFDLKGYNEGSTDVDYSLSE